MKFIRSKSNTLSVPVAFSVARSILIGVPLMVVCLSFFYKTYTRNRDWQNSIIYWEPIVRQYPTHLAASLNLAEAYQTNLMPEKAIKQYQHILELKPDFATSYLRIGQIKQYYGDFPAAITAYEKALEISPKLGEARYYKSITHYVYARQFLETNNIDQAILQLTSARISDPNNFEAQLLYQNTCQKYPSKCQQ